MRERIETSQINTTANKRVPDVPTRFNPVPDKSGRDMGRQNKYPTNWVPGYGHLYLIGVIVDLRSYTASTLDFAFECLHIECLGMPLTSKRYRAANCEYLVDKITNQIRS